MIFSCQCCADTNLSSDRLTAGSRPPQQRAILLRSTDKLAWPRVKTAEPVEVTGVYFPDCSRAADRLLHDESGTVTTVILLEPGTYYLSVEPGEPDLSNARFVRFG